MTENLFHQLREQVKKKSRHFFNFRSCAIANKAMHKDFRWKILAARLKVSRDDVDLKKNHKIADDLLRRTNLITKNLFQHHCANQLKKKD